MEVLNSIKVADAAQFVKNLSTEEQDVLMKYLYAGMAVPEQNNPGTLLAWHEKVLLSVGPSLLKGEQRDIRCSDARDFGHMTGCRLKNGRVERPQPFLCRRHVLTMQLYLFYLLIAHRSCWTGMYCACNYG